MLTEAELDRMRAAAQAAMPDVAAVQRPQHVPDGAGGSTTTWTTVTGELPCRVVSQSGGEDSVDGRPETTAAFRVTVPWDADIDTTDRLIIGTLTGTLTVEVAHVSSRGAWTVSGVVEAFEVTT